MREIKFRGKRVDNGEWVHGDIAHHDGVVSHIGQHPADGSMVIYELTPETVGQFIGLLDKNCKEIYEGDRCLKNQEIWAIKWLKEYGRFVPMRSNGVWVASFGQVWTRNCEVIGNIHDNPEGKELK